MIEVGTTNRTYAADYERVAQRGDVLLKVHKSNYEIEGFAHEATVAELVAVARAQRLPRRVRPRQRRRVRLRGREASGTTRWRRS